MFLREQFRIAGIEFQQFLYIFELRLRVLDVFIDIFQRFRQLGRIAPISTVMPLMRFAINFTSVLK